MTTEFSMPDRVDLTDSESRREAVGDWERLVKTSRVAHAIVSGDDVIRSVNDSWCELFDAPRAQLVGLPIQHLLHPEDRPRTVEITARAQRTHAAAGWRARYVKPSGATFDGQATVAPMIASDGLTTDAVYSLVDVSDEAESINALADSERKFRMLASNSGDLVLWVRSGVVLWASPACAKFGWEADQLIDGSSMDLVHPDDRYLAEAARDERDFSTEEVRLRFRFMTGDGGFRWVEAHAAPFRDDNGAVDGIVSVIRDISAQVATEDGLRAREREFRLLAENAADVVIRFNEDGVRQWVSDSVRDLLGWDPDDFIKAPLQSLIHPGDQPNEHVGGERPAMLIDTAAEFRIKHGDGHWVWVSKKSRALIDGSYIEALRCIDDEIAARGAAQDAIADLAYRSSHDLLTGLRNRAEVIKSLEDALASRGRDESVAVLFIDIDRFKEVNDGISHAAGDEVLQQVAEQLSTQLSGSDCIGRLGGDEFAVVLRRLTSIDAAADCADRLKQAIARCEFTSQGQRVPVTVSIGVAVSRESQTPHDILSDADAALYEAKNAGRNRWELANDNIRESAMRRIGLSGRIRSGIDAGEFHAWYQPIVDLADRRVLGYEALARWITPDGVVAASDFIATAEDSGMINDLGGQVLSEAIARIPHLPPEMIMSVNASASQLVDPGFAARVLTQLGECGARPEQLVIEITEHSLLNLEKAARADLLALTDRGIGIYVDDFGTGYSSLATLLDYPVTGLKLDCAFAERLSKDANGPTSRLVAGLIELTDRLELRGIAEGIETARQESLLRKLGWHCGQGWLFGHAEPPHEYPKVPQMRRPVDVREGRGVTSRTRPIMAD